MEDARIKQAMTELGKPNSMQFYEVLKSLATDAYNAGLAEGKKAVDGE